MVNPSVNPPGLMESVYGPKARERAVNVMDMVSVSIGDLFPDITDRIYNYGDDLSAIGKSADEALSSVDMTMIQPEHTVKILSSEHGYSIMGGEAYVRMLKALADPTRLEILRVVAAQSGPVCACDIVDRYELTQPTISHHLKVLRDAGLLSSRRKGLWSFYQPDPAGLEALSGLPALLAGRGR